MSGSAQNVKLGICNVFFDGVDLGLTKGGVDVEVTTNTHEVTVDQHGTTPVGEILTGRMVSANVPLVETTLDNLLRIMPGSVLTTDGEFASGTVTFSTSAPVNGNKVTVLGQTFTFKTTPTGNKDMAIPADVAAAAEALADVINGSVIPVHASAAAGVVTITADSRGVDSNSAIAVTGANIATTDLTGGAEVTTARVKVSDGVNINLLDIAKRLKLRPIGTTGADDFIIEKAACPGALNFTYNVDQERIYTANFKGYVDDEGNLFSIGEESAA